MEILDTLNRFGTKRFILVVADLCIVCISDVRVGHRYPEFQGQTTNPVCPLRPRTRPHTLMKGRLHPKAWTHTSRDNIYTAHYTSLEYVSSNKTVQYVLMRTILGSSQFVIRVYQSVFLQFDFTSSAAFIFCPSVRWWTQGAKQEVQFSESFFRLKRVQVMSQSWIKTVAHCFFFSSFHFLTKVIILRGFNVIK